MENWSTYSRKQWVKAVNYSAVLGYVGMVGLPGAANGNFGGVLVAAVLGVPIALLCCWVFAAPILRFAMRKRIGWLAAAVGGASIGALMALVAIVIGRYRGWRVSIDPDRSFGAYAGGDTTIIDGVLTTHGWLLLAQTTVNFILMGALIAIVVKWLIGKPEGHGRS